LTTWSLVAARALVAVASVAAGALVAVASVAAGALVAVAAGASTVGVASAPHAASNWAIKARMITSPMWRRAVRREIVTRSFS
jgi:hypothetical protein